MMVCRSESSEVHLLGLWAATRDGDHVARLFRGWIIHSLTMVSPDAIDIGVIYRAPRLIDESGRTPPFAPVG
jgi:hypothetical protein